MNNKNQRVVELQLLFKYHEYLNRKNIHEEWKPIYINNEKTNYECSSFGRIVHIINNKHYFLTPIRMPNGYYVITLYHNKNPYRDYIHRIIAKEFIKIPPIYTNINLTFNDLEVNHINGKQKWNNSIYNLEWVDDKTNKNHGYKTGLYKKGNDSHLATHTADEIEYICQLIVENKLSISEIAKMTNNKPGFVYDILYNGSWKDITNKYDFSNYKPKQQKYSNEQLQLLKKLLLDKNKSFQEISDLTGIKIKTVYYYNNKFNK